MAIERFETIQENHLRSLISKDIDLPRMIFERSQGFEDLRSALNHLRRNGRTPTEGDTDPSRIRRESRSRLLFNERPIHEALGSLRMDLRERMVRSRQVKKAVGRYAATRFGCEWRE
jgi:hypothetical protein